MKEIVSVAFDSNIFIKNRRQDGAFWKEFREFRKLSNCSVLIPHVVLIELSRRLYDKQQLEAEEFITTLSKAKETLEKFRDKPVLIKHSDSSVLEELSNVLQKTSSGLSVSSQLNDRLESVKNLIKSLTGGDFKELDLPNVSHRDLLVRCCVEERRPFRTRGDSKNKTASDHSYRDALIWYSLLSYLETEACDQFFFISSNYQDFSHSKSSNKLHQDLIEELSKAEIKCKFKYFEELQSFTQSVYTRTLHEEVEWGEKLVNTNWFSEGLSAIEGSPIQGFTFKTVKTESPELYHMLVTSIRVLSVGSVKKVDSNEIRIEATILISTSEYRRTEAPEDITIKPHQLNHYWTKGVFFVNTKEEKIGNFSLTELHRDAGLNCRITLSTNPEFNQLLLQAYIDTDFQFVFGDVSNSIDIRSRDNLKRCLNDLGIEQSRIEIVKERLETQSLVEMVFELESVPSLILYKWGLINLEDIDYSSLKTKQDS